MSKLTPAQSFMYLKALFPMVEFIRNLGNDWTQVKFRGSKSFHKLYGMNVNWGKQEQFPPEQNLVEVKPEDLEPKEPRAAIDKTGKKLEVCNSCIKVLQTSLKELIANGS